MCKNSVPGSQLPTCWVVGVNSKAQVSPAPYHLGGAAVCLHSSEVLSEFVELLLTWALMGPLANGTTLLQGKFDKAILCLSYDFSTCYSFLAETVIC